MLGPRKYQTDAIDAFCSLLARKEARRAVIVLPTGTGKTLTALMAAKQFGPPVLWLAHRDELVQQPLKAAEAVWPEAQKGIVKAGLDEWRRDIVFASIQTACRDQRLGRLARRPWTLVVVDECHHAPSLSWRKVVDGVGCLGPEGPPLLGLTATPERLDSARLDDIFEKVAYQYHLHQAIKDGYLAPPEIVLEPMKINLDNVRTTAGDLNAGDLDKVMLENGIVDSICDAFRKHAIDKKTLIFTVSVEQAKQVADKMADHGVCANHVDGSMEIRKRRLALRQFSIGALQVISNCAVLTEGFDEPTIECIIMARPTKSKSLYIQCAGRGLRLAPGKDSCKIVDMVALSGRHSLVQAPVIFGAELPEQEGKPSDRALFRVDPVEYWKQRLSTQVLGLQSISRSDFRWIRGNSGELLLGVGNYGTVRLRPSAGEWMCEIIGCRETGRSLERLSDTPVGLELAQGIGEDYVRRCKAVTLARGGKWRDQPATDAQLQALRKWKIDPPPGLSKGQASEMLTACAAKMYEPATEKQIRYLQRLGASIPNGLTKKQAGKLIVQYRG